MLAARGDSRDSISSALGLPRSSSTLSIWLRVDVPGNMAFPTINSPIMQPNYIDYYIPTDHISTALLYFVEPSRISGALYHLVATYSVRINASIVINYYYSGLPLPRQGFALTQNQQPSLGTQN